MRRLAVILVSILLTVALATSAAATPPERYEFEFTSTELYMPCDGFEELGDSSGAVAGTVFLDKDGVAIRNTEHWKLTVTVYRADGVGGELVERYSWTNTFVPPETSPDGQFVATSITRNLTAPGHGVVYKVSGHQVWDWSQWPPYAATAWNLAPRSALTAQEAICTYFS